MILKYIKLRCSSSFHILNADTHLKKPLKIVFRIISYINNLCPNNRLDKTLKIKSFIINNKEQLDIFLSKINMKHSPSRSLCELFWLNLPLDIIKKQLGQLNILDIGCGKGIYAEKFINLKHINSYTGIDVKEYENWNTIEKTNSNVRFYVYNGKDVPINHNINIIISQAVLEHVECDLQLFDSIYRKIKNRNIIQFHLIPSKACFNLYKFHGVRQYTPRTISKITKKFKHKTYKILFNLGGDKCNIIHTSFITYPRKHGIGDLRKDNISLYKKTVNLAIKKDMLKNQHHPNFYALIIHSNYKNKIL